MRVDSIDYYFILFVVGVYGSKQREQRKQNPLFLFEYIDSFIDPIIT